MIADSPSRSDAEVPTSLSDATVVRILAWLVVVAGAVMAIAGVATWVAVQGQLANEDITVSADADLAAGQQVNGPVTAWSQANVINEHALEASGGATFAQLDQDDPTRDVVMTASFLRASLFTSVVAFGVAAMATGLGLVLVAIGLALLRLAGRRQVA